MVSWMGVERGGEERRMIPYRHACEAALVKLRYDKVLEQIKLCLGVG